MVYANKPSTINELCTNIEHEILAESADLCLKIIKNAESGLLLRGGDGKENEFNS